MQTFFATCARGFEELLKQELESFGAQECKLTQGSVYFSSLSKENNESLALAYKSLLHTRFASRILLPLKTVPAYDDMTLYLGIKQMDWPNIIAEDASMVVHFTGENEEIRNTQYGAQRVKDAIVDRYLQDKLPRPHIDKNDPDIRVHIYLNKDEAHVSLDLSGEALNQRGYRTQTGAAPLKETLAAVIVKRSGWQVTTPLIDPFCGSGTLLIEAAMIASNMAANLLRHHWGFFAWKGHNPEIWQSVKQSALETANLGREALIKQCESTGPLFFGFDNDPVMIKHASKNAEQLGLRGVFEFQIADITELSNPIVVNTSDEPSHQITGTLLMNPPYGERLHSEPELIALYSQIGLQAKSHFPGWQLSVFTSSDMLLSCLQLRASKQFKAKNGPLECIQKNYALSSKKKAVDSNNNKQSHSDSNATSNIDKTIQSESNRAIIAVDFANRLKKNCQKLDKWAAAEGIECYRIYDADLPEYNVAIDRYAEYVVLQEYAPPKTVDEQVARKRRFDAINTTLAVLELSPQQLILKTRERQSGQKQYNRMAQKENMIEVNEYHAQFWVNLTDYLDTGLFLDHRLARRMLGEMAKGKDFLNLFSYTGSATVFAALGGAKSTTSVDLSNTYLNWAERNLQLNGISGRQHQLIQADCLYWLSVMQTELPQYDLIFVDPPTFSNSKRMHESFDVQRDYIEILQGLKALLRPNGTILFSNNRRGFKLDNEAVNTIGFNATNITDKTRSLDFARNKHIHQSWLIKHND
ncbi:bifunctional 23S rRNA (guanine(2069)-N(7))-methyltransferase RlmK/23S rRNA (guanine(2445)-N(2))-methyltransferase RlmL [Thorsellia anophelis]|uniref:Ribosomal RNA large subunit methyltransferase K/L n=1 Tax=Thorsellia anophelis DSM 18579 TaxID=1123402 RepID=A0A1I0ARD6_9GAMM|nr:bifunctional 23S rRNA (guanine(2069)-N(7))-methyltransferase RlmK/23S rRNA (guanine(2445)-N(2))-methyltransferase RlmL [Thorsellia anophelis]SES96302.1 23S rRNA (guanine2445-N2)-methyltransferase / 23S rRNA (guanine2069-N7)-methyltransferase [Thorsellia anophelis DSM 18579]